MHRADAVPVRRALGDIGRGLLAASLSRDFESRSVGLQRRIVGRYAADKVAGQGFAGIGQTKESPGAFTLTLGKAGVDKQLEMTRHARLRLTEDCDKLADRKFGLAEQGNQPKPGHFAGGL